MPSYEKFQTKNAKYTQNRADRNEPEFNSTIASSVKKSTSFHANIDKWTAFCAWAKWYPDLFLDLITPKRGGICLDLDQRVLLRCIMRYKTVYGVFPRGYGKTMIEVLAQMLMDIFYPGIETTMTAQTRENASKLLKEKYIEITNKFYPLLANEFISAKFQKDFAELTTTSLSKTDIMANHQSSKGARRKRLMVEESALLNNELYEQVLEPIVNIPRRTVGNAIVNPEELNGQICFFTTSGYRNSDEWHRCNRLIDDMIYLKGTIFLSSDWKLACYFNRGENKSQILNKKANLSPTAFAQNYESRWVGCVDNQLVDITRIMKLRTLVNFEKEGKKTAEYILGVDVARSQNKANNQSSVSVLKLNKSKTGRISNIHLVNLITISNALNFTSQAIEIKKIKKLFNAKMVVVDGNGLGVGLIDELLKENLDNATGESFECWDTVNTDNEPEVRGCEKCVFDLKPQTDQNGIIVAFIDMVESSKIRLLEKRVMDTVDINSKDSVGNILPYMQTDTLVEEIANLQIKHGTKLSLTQVLKKIDKDRIMSLMYGLWYIKNNENNVYKEDEEESVLDYMLGYVQ
jgi:hypothetical protein